MESKWLKDSLFNGMTANAFKLGTVLSLGWFWMRPSGCYTVYRGQDGYIDQDRVQAVMGVNAQQVSIPAQFLPADTIWHYVRRRVSGCGLESGDSPACIIRIGSDGNMYLAAPNVPMSLVAEIMSGGKIRLRWRYSAIGQEIAPSGFNIYIDSGSGFNYGVADATVSYGLGGNEFNWTSPGLVHGNVYRFTVRSFNTTGAETANTDFVSAAADSVGPPAITGIRASWESA